LKQLKHYPELIKNTASQHAYICRPPARCASRSGTLAQLAGGSLRLCAGLQPAALIAASTQPVGIRVLDKDFRQKGSFGNWDSRRKSKKENKGKKGQLNSKFKTGFHLR